MAATKQYQCRVSVDIDEVQMRKAVRDLGKSHGINVVIDPKVKKQAETPVSLQLENTSLETSLRLLAEMASLKAVRMGNVMFVTSEEKAKVIRDEESHQPDTPLYGGPAPVNGVGGVMPVGAIQVQPPGGFLPPPGGVPPLPFGGAALPPRMRPDSSSRGTAACPTPTQQPTPPTPRP